MEENEKKVTLAELQQSLSEQIAGGLKDEEIGPTLDAFKLVSEALGNERKAENEAARIEMERAKSVRETEAANARSERELKGNKLRAAGQVGASIVAAVASVVTVDWILHAEKHDRLFLSKAIGFIIRPRG